MNPELSDYIATQRHAGFDDVQIKNELRAAGWAENDIEAAFAPAQTHSENPEQPPEPEHGIKPGPHLLAETWHGYVHNFWKLIGAQLLGILAVVLISVPSLFLAYSKSVYLDLAAFALIIFVAVFIQAWSIVAEVIIVDSDGASGFIGAFRQALPRIWKYIWTFILMGLVGYGAMILGFLILIPIFLLTKSIRYFEFGFAIPFLIGIVTYTFIGLSPILAALGEASGMKAILASRSYSDGRFFKVLLRLLFPIVLVILTAIPAAFSANYKTVFEYGFGLIIGPFIAVYIVKLINDLKRSNRSTRTFRKWPYVTLAIVTVATIIVGILATLLLFYIGEQKGIQIPFLNNFSAPMASTSPTSQSSANGQTHTYSNTKYNYSFQYPAGWQVNTQYADNDFEASDTAYTDNGSVAIISGNYSVASRLTIFPNSASDQRDWLNFQLIKPDPVMGDNGFIDNYVKQGDFSRADLTINGHPAVLVVENQTSADGHQDAAIFIPNGDMLYYFQSFNVDTLSAAMSFNFQ